MYDLTIHPQRLIVMVSASRCVTGGYWVTSYAIDPLTVACRSMVQTFMASPSTLKVRLSWCLLPGA